MSANDAPNFIHALLRKKFRILSRRSREARRRIRNPQFPLRASAPPRESHSPFRIMSRLSREARRRIPP